MTKKSRIKNENNTLVSFVDELIDSKEKEIDSLMVECSDLYHEVIARQILLEEKKKLSSSDDFLFSPNDSGKLSYFDNEWLSQYDSLKKLQSEKNKILSEAQNTHEMLLKLKSFMSDTTIGKSDNEDNDLEFSDVQNVQSFEIQEMERNRIANDLHDTAVQNLTGLIHKGELCMRLFDIDPIRAKMEMSSIIDVAKVTIDDIRSSIFELRPASIDDFGLLPAIEDYCNHINPDRRLSFFIDEEGEKTELSNTVLVTLYRISQEACINIIKHSNATKSNIHILYAEDSVTLTITDNGRGISQDKLDDAFKSKTHFGLKILQERTNLVHGELNISNIKNGGLKIQVVIPINK